jgi:hypothetical protein
MKRCRTYYLFLILALAVSAVLLMQQGLAAQANWSRVRVAHAVPGGPEVDVYVDGEEVASDVAYQDVTPYESLLAGPHSVEVRLSSLPITLISETVVLTGGMDATVVGVGQGLNITATLLQDDNSPANINSVRFVHLSPGTSAIDVNIKGTAALTLAGNFPFKGASDYIGGLMTGLYRFEVRPAGQITPLETFSATLEINTINTVFIMGLTDSLEAVHTVDQRFFRLFLPIVLSE